jgi:hypothetical protein
MRKGVAMRKRTCLVCVVTIFLVFGLACHGRERRYVKLRDDTKIYFKSAAIVQRGYLWDSRGGNFELRNNTGVKEVSRDLSGVDELDVLSEEMHEGRRYFSICVYFKSARRFQGYLGGDINKGWDYVELKTKEGTETIPLYNVSSINFD